MKKPRSELSILREIGRLLSGSSQLPDLVETIAAAGTALGGADAGWLALYDEERGKLEHASSHNLSPKSVDALSEDVDSWAPASASEVAEPVVLKNPGENSTLGQVAARESLSGAAVIPITHADSLVGALAAFWSKPGHPTSNDISPLLLLANQAGIAIANARLLSEVRHRATAVDAILNVTQMIGASPKLGYALNVVMDEANHLFGTDMSSIRLLDPNTRELVIRSSRGLSKGTLRRIRLRVGRGVGGWVAKHGKPLILNDVSKDPRFSYFPKDAEKVSSLMSVPLIVEGKTIGVLTIASSQPKSFTHEDESVLVTLASQAAIVLENARLYEQVRRRLAEQKVLYGIAQHLASTLDVPTLLKFIINHLSAFFRAKFATMRLLDETGTFLQTGATFGITDEYIRHANENMQLSLDPSTPGGQSPAAVAIREKRICAISDIARDRRFTDWRKAAKMQSYTSVVSVPLIPTDTPIGVLSLYFQDVRRLQPEEYELLQVASRTSAIALQRAMLDERLLKEEVSRRALEEVSHLKTEFVSLVSHELRTPLTSIQGYVKLILAGHTGDLNPLQAEFLTTVGRNTDRLVALVDDLLDISRIETGRLELVLESLRLEDIVQSEVESLKSQADEKDIAITVDLEEGLPRVKADSHRLGQVISNLLDNAIKYSLDHSAVKITANQIGKNVLVKVIDSGIGISPEERGKLFQRFYRGDSDLVRSTWGTGLGLAITHHLVEMHGGKVWVESEKGHGSTFTFTIPGMAGDVQE